MITVARIDGLVEGAVRDVPDELREELRDWISRAHKGELTEVSDELLRKADAAWRAFDNAAKKVEGKLQE